MNCASWKAGQRQGAQPAGREPRPAIMLSGQLEAGVDGIDSRQPTAHNQLPLLRPAGTTRLPASGQLEARMDGHHAKGQVLVVNAAEASCLNHLQERVPVVAAVWASSRAGDSRRLIKAAAPQASRLDHLAVVCAGSVQCSFNPFADRPLPPTCTAALRIPHASLLPGSLRGLLLPSSRGLTGTHPRPRLLVGEHADALHQVLVAGGVVGHHPARIQTRSGKVVDGWEGTASPVLVGKGSRHAPAALARDTSRHAPCRSRCAHQPTPNERSSTIINVYAGSPSPPDLGDDIEGVEVIQLLHARHHHLQAGDAARGQG